MNLINYHCQFLKVLHLILFLNTKDYKQEVCRAQLKTDMIVYNISNKSSSTWLAQITTIKMESDV